MSDRPQSHTFKNISRRRNPASRSALINECCGSSTVEEKCVGKKPYLYDFLFLQAYDFP